MRIQVLLEFDLRECDPDGAETEGILRLPEMPADHICDLVQNGFSNLIGAIGGDMILAFNNEMFEGEDHFLFLNDPEVKQIKIVEDTQ